MLLWRIRLCFPGTEMDLPHAGRISGMGIRRGITLIAGGGYHGKSTLLHALERGVYNHIAGDGREYVITDRSAMKIRAEDGRSIACDDISLFISNLPGGKDTVRFSSENASGSTSQAASVVEAAEAGARLLLIDEDTSATNFMVRDALMQRVIAPEKEPITPFIDRARLLFEKHGISTILALGSSGAWFIPADCILQMDEYRPVDITQRAKEAAQEEMAGSLRGRGAPDLTDAGPSLPSSDLSPRRVPLPDRTFAAVEQIVDPEQSAALAQCLLYAGRHLMDGKRTVREIADILEDLMSEKGPGAAAEGSYTRTGLALPRREEICAMLSRFRGLRIR